MSSLECEAWIRYLQGMWSIYQAAKRGVRHLPGSQMGCEACTWPPTGGIRWVKDTHKENEVGMRHLQGVQGFYKSTTRHTRQAGVWDKYKIAVRSMRQVWDTYKGYETYMSYLQGYKVGTSHLQGAQGDTRYLEGVWDWYETPTRGMRQVQETYEGY